EISLERRFHQRAEIRVADGDVDLEVRAQRLIVEVERADSAPNAVDHGGFGVHHRALPFEHADAAAHEAGPRGAARVADDFDVDFPRHDHAHVDSVTRRAAK